jgi:hypothetical protein
VIGRKSVAEEELIGRASHIEAGIMHGGNARAGGGPSTRRDRVAAAKLNRLRRGFRQSRPGFRHDVARARSLAGG